MSTPSGRHPGRLDWLVAVQRLWIRVILLRLLSSSRGISFAAIRKHSGAGRLTAERAGPMIRALNEPRRGYVAVARGVGSMIGVTIRRLAHLRGQSEYRVATSRGPLGAARRGAAGRTAGKPDAACRRSDRGNRTNLGGYGRR